MTVANQAIRAGDQVQYLYRRTGNDSLLIYYGFCVRDNPYDRVRFRLRMDQGPLDGAGGVAQLIVKDFIEQDQFQSNEISLNGTPVDRKFLTSEFRLKRSEVNTHLLDFLRTFDKFSNGGSDAEVSQIQQPEQIAQEVRLLAVYAQILDNLRADYLDSGFRNPFLDLYNAEKLQIVQAQGEMVRTLSEVLQLICEEEIDFRDACIRVVELRNPKGSERSLFQQFRRIQAYCKQIYYSVLLKLAV